MGDDLGSSVVRAMPRGGFLSARNPLVGVFHHAPESGGSWKYHRSSLISLTQYVKQRALRHHPMTGTFHSTPGVYSALHRLSSAVNVPPERSGSVPSSPGKRASDSPTRERTSSPRSRDSRPPGDVQRERRVSKGSPLDLGLGMFEDDDVFGDLEALGLPPPAPDAAAFGTAVRRALIRAPLHERGLALSHGPAQWGAVDPLERFVGFSNDLDLPSEAAKEEGTPPRPGRGRSGGLDDNGALDPAAGSPLLVGGVGPLHKGGDIPISALQHSKSAGIKAGDMALRSDGLLGLDDRANLPLLGEPALVARTATLARAVSAPAPASKHSVPYMTVSIGKCRAFEETPAVASPVARGSSAPFVAGRVVKIGRSVMSHPKELGGTVGRRGPPTPPSLSSLERSIPEEGLEEWDALPDRHPAAEAIQAAPKLAAAVAQERERRDEAASLERMHSYDFGWDDPLEQRARIDRVLAEAKHSDVTIGGASHSVLVLRRKRPVVLPIGRAQSVEDRGKPAVVGPGPKAAVANSAAATVGAWKSSKPVVWLGLVPLQESDSAPTRRLEDEWELGGKLGDGGYAVVKAATRKRGASGGGAVPDEVSDAVVKCIRKRFLTTDEERSCVRREFEIHRTLVHPRIVRLWASFEDESFAYLVMERINGGNLSSHIKSERIRVAQIRRAKLARGIEGSESPRSRHGLLPPDERDGLMSEAAARRVVEQLLEALAYIHKRDVVHADIKPENILLVRSGRPSEGERAPKSHHFLGIKLCDFGHSRLARDARYYRVTGDVGLVPFESLLGTSGYIAPEVLQGHHYNAGIDMWACGVILYEMIAGFPPFRPAIQCLSETLRFPDKGWRGVSSACKDLCARLLSTDPKKRLRAEQALAHQWFRPVVD
jgi:serine/threonine protein kinase